MTEMILAEPAMAGRILARHAGPAEPGGGLGRRDPRGRGGRDADRRDRLRHLRACGPGRRRHPARRGSRGGPAGRRRDRGPGLRAAAWIRPSSGLVIGVSHEGGTGATNAALAAARAAGARTAFLTVSSRSPGAACADPSLVVETGELDQSWCHTVGLREPDAGRRRRSARTCPGDPLDIEGVVELLAAGTRDEAGADRIAGRLADAAHLLVVASGTDRTAGRELVLKVEEASWLPSAFRDLETFLHGHLPATGSGHGPRRCC